MWKYGRKMFLNHLLLNFWTSGKAVSNRNKWNSHLLGKVVIVHLSCPQPRLVGQWSSKQCLCFGSTLQEEQLSCRGDTHGISARDRFFNRGPLCS